MYIWRVSESAIVRRGDWLEHEAFCIYTFICLCALWRFKFSFNPNCPRARAFAADRDKRGALSPTIYIHFVSYYLSVCGLLSTKLANHIRCYVIIHTHTHTHRDNTQILIYGIARPAMTTAQTCNVWQRDHMCNTTEYKEHPARQLREICWANKHTKAPSHINIFE